MVRGWLSLSSAPASEEMSDVLPTRQHDEARGRWLRVLDPRLLELQLLFVLVLLGRDYGFLCLYSYFYCYFRFFFLALLSRLLLPVKLPVTHISASVWSGIVKDFTAAALIFLNATIMMVELELEGIWGSIQANEHKRSLITISVVISICVFVNRCGSFYQQH